VPLPSAHYFDDIDPQCDFVITTEIASGRFEDDIRRMRMAAWHGADHLMVIRTAGQSHYDGLIEGTPRRHRRHSRFQETGPRDPKGARFDRGGSRQDLSIFIPM